jgi:RNA polymerase sigma-70 factor, ECF subfamily
VTEPFVKKNGGDSPSTSRSLLDLARTNNDDAWNQIVALYSPLVMRWCRQSGLAAADIEDVGQEVFKSVYASLDTFQKASVGQSFRAWLRTITRNKVTDFYRSTSHQPKPRGGEGLDANSLPTPTDSDSWDEHSEDQEERILVLRRCLELVRTEFEPKTWDAFWKVVVDDISPADVAVSLGIKPNSVYLARSRVQKRLRELFDRLVDDFDTVR